MFGSIVNAAETRWSSFTAGFKLCFHCRFCTPCSSNANIGLPISKRDVSGYFVYSCVEKNKICRHMKQRSCVQGGHSGCNGCRNVVIRQVAVSTAVRAETMVDGLPRACRLWHAKAHVRSKHTEKVACRDGILPLLHKQYCLPSRASLRRIWTALIYNIEVTHVR